MNDDHEEENPKYETWTLLPDKEKKDRLSTKALKKQLKEHAKTDEPIDIQTLGPKLQANFDIVWKHAMKIFQELKALDAETDGVSEKIRAALLAFYEDLIGNARFLLRDIKKIQKGQEVQECYTAYLNRQKRYVRHFEDNFQRLANKIKGIKVRSVVLGGMAAAGCAVFTAGLLGVGVLVTLHFIPGVNFCLACSELLLLAGIAVICGAMGLMSIAALVWSALLWVKNKRRGRKLKDEKANALERELMVREELTAEGKELAAAKVAEIVERLSGIISYLRNEEAKK